MATAPTNVPVTVQNHDVASLLDGVARFVVEVHKSVSSSVSVVNKFDRDRLLKYLEALDVQHDWILSVPELDLPETHPKDWEVESFPVISDIENDALNHVIRLFSVAYEELANSQSARIPASLTTHDSARFRSYIEKVRKFVTEYIDKAASLDLPESSPMEASSGSGLKGVNPK